MVWVRVMYTVVKNNGAEKRGPRCRLSKIKRFIPKGHKARTKDVAEPVIKKYLTGENKTRLWYKKQDYGTKNKTMIKTTL